MTSVVLLLSPVLLRTCSMPAVCGDCGHGVGDALQHSTHFLCCNHLKGKFATERHDAIQAVVKTAADRAGLSTRLHVRNRTGDNNRATDVTFSFGDELLNLVDFVVALAPSYVAEQQPTSCTRLRS